MENKKIKPFILILGILTFFIFIISFAVFYTTENFSVACGCKLSPWVIIVSISSLGLFVGFSMYYLLSINFLREKKEIKHNMIKFLDLLEKEDKKILKYFIENSGEIVQSSLSKKFEFDKVKISRIISKFENKGIIKKEKQGMTNKLILDEDLRNLFEN